MHAASPPSASIGIVDSKQAIVLGFGAFSFDMLFLAKSSFLLFVVSGVCYLCATHGCRVSGGSKVGLIGFGRRE